MATSTSYGNASFGQLTVEDKTFYEMVMLDRAVPNFLYIYFGLSGMVQGTITLPENEGSTIQWNKMNGFTAVTTPLQESITPEPQSITITTTTAQVREYGAYIRYTRTLAEMGVHKVIDEATNALGEQAGDSLDLITRAALIADTTTVQYVNGRANDDAIVATDYISFAEAMEAVVTLRNNKAVAPLAGNKFPVIIHPYTEYDLFSDPVIQAVLIHAKDRGDSNDMVTGFIGDIANLSFYESANGYYAANSTPVNVYSSLVIGKGAFGVGGLAAYMPQIINEQQTKNGKANHTFEKVRPLRLITHEFGSTGTADPFDRLASVAWFTTFVVKVLQGTFYLQLRSASRLG